MAKPHNPTAPVQARAKQTEDELLDAAENLLRTGGLEACTVPAIAELAERSIGAVYRRFPDKDSLLQAVFRRYSARAAVTSGRNLEQANLSDLSLEDAARSIVHGMIRGQRKERRLIGAFLQYARNHADSAFRRVVHADAKASLDRLAGLLLASRREIKHSKPEKAVEVVLSTLSLTIQGMFQADDTHPLARLEDDDLARELTSLVTAYLMRKG